MERYWVGADPGGKGKFGLAFLSCDGDLSSARVSSVDQAAELIVDRGKPLGLGIDAPMWWSAGVGGGRRSDELLRRNYGSIPSGTVQSVNSLRGAVLAGGALLAFKIREQFDCAKITEAHPKALLHALEVDRDRFPEEFGLCGWSDNEDEQDAAIAAVCAMNGFTKAWPTDLAGERFRHASEQDPQRYWLAPIHYFWPHDLAASSS